MTKELTTIQKSLSPIVDKALSITIKKPEDMVEATTLLSKLNSFNDRIKEEREKVTAPLNEALKAERARWKPAESANLEAIDYIRAEMSRYQTAQIAIQKAKEHAIAEKLTSGKISMDKAVAQIEKVKTPEKTVTTDAGAVQFRETAILKIWDYTMIPNEFMLPDEKKILATLKEGKKVAGCEIEMIQVPVNYR